MKTFNEFIAESAKTKVEFAYVGSPRGSFSNDEFRRSLDKFMQLGAEVSHDGRYDIVTIEGPAELINKWHKQKDVEMRYYRVPKK
jgi:hypothetical protein